MSSNLSPVEAQNVARSIARYRKDFRAFAQEQLRLTADSPIKFWPCQVPLVESIEEQFATQGFVRSVWLKARQVGASTLAQCFVSWRAMLWPNINAIVIADESQRAQTLFEISRGFYDYMDEEIRPVGRYVTKRELVFANPSHATRSRDPGLRSRIVIDSAHKKNIAIGAAWTIALLSEAARYREPNFVFDGIIPAVHRIPGTMIIIESSAEMAGTWYRDFFEEAKRGKNGFNAKFVPWFLQPEYFICPICRALPPNICNDEGHVKKALRTMDFTADERHILAEFKLQPGHVQWMREKFAEFGNDWNLFRQNFPLTDSDAWVTPGAQAFPSKQLKELRDMICPPKRRCEVNAGPRIFDSPQGRLQIWKEPEPNKAYDIGVDVASGTADSEEQDTLDFSVACVLERGSNDQVAEWCSKAMSALEMATMLYWLGTYYNTAQIAIETNGIGGSTNAQMAKIGYSNVYLWRYRDELVPRYSKKTGWETNLRSKPWLVGFAVHEMINGRAKIHSELLHREMEMYVQKGPRDWGAVAGSHDDRVVAWMIALLTSDDECFERYYGLRKSVSKEATTDDTAKRKPRPWECDSTFLKGDDKNNDWLPWEDPGVERSFF